MNKFYDLTDYAFSTYDYFDGDDFITFDIKAVSKQEIMIDGNTQPIAFNEKECVIRSCAMGSPTWSSQKADGTIFKSLRIGSIEYIPDKNDIIE